MLKDLCQNGEVKYEITSKEGLKEANELINQYSKFIAVDRRELCKALNSGNDEDYDLWFDDLCCNRSHILALRKAKREYIKSLGLREAK